MDGIADCNKQLQYQYIVRYQQRTPVNMKSTFVSYHRERVNEWSSCDHVTSFFCWTSTCCFTRNNCNNTFDINSTWGWLNDSWKKSKKNFRCHGGDHCLLSDSFTEVKAHRPQPVLGWVTTREDRMPWTCVRSSVWTLLCDWPPKYSIEATDVNLSKKRILSERRFSRADAALNISEFLN